MQKYEVFSIWLHNIFAQVVNVLFFSVDSIVNDS